MTERTMTRDSGEQYTMSTGEVAGRLGITKKRLKHVLEAEHQHHVLDWKRDERNWKVFTPASVEAERERRAEQPGYFKTPPALEG